MQPSVIKKFIHFFALRNDRLLPMNYKNVLPNSINCKLHYSIVIPNHYSDIVTSQKNKQQ